MKRLVVCCDGTWNKEDAPAAVTNVVRMSRAVLQVDPRNAVTQITFYHAGVGTGDLFDQLGGGAVGLGLSRAVRDCYAFIAGNYVPGDEIFLFGFSRGAYTARSVAGLIGWAGLLNKPGMDRFGELWTSYKQRDPNAKGGPSGFPDRQASVPIRCIGVWDTVGALGIPGHAHQDFMNFYQFHDTTLGEHVAFAFHALALDERRADFEPTLWKQKPEAAAAGQVVEQVWFPGVHANVGGGYDEHGLSDIALAWMAARVGPLLALDMDYIVSRQDRRDLWAMGRLYDSAGSWFALRPKAPRRPFTTQPQSATREAVHVSALERGADGAKPNPGRYALMSSGQAQADYEALERTLRWTAVVPAAPRPVHGLVAGLVADIVADLRRL